MDTKEILSFSNQPAGLLECVLHAVFLGRNEAIPLTPEEVAAHDLQHSDLSPLAIKPPRTPSMLFSWERRDVHSSAAQVLSFPQPFGFSTMAYAAREGSSVSSETKRKLSRIVADMRQEAREQRA